MKKLVVGILSLLLLAGVFFFIANIGSVSKVPVETGMGENPSLPEPDKRLLPIVKIAPAVGWSGDDKPIATTGLKVAAFAKDLDHPRWLYVLPNGDVLVSESNSPNQMKGIKGIKGWAAKKVLEKAGAGVPSADRITLLRDSTGDGVADTRSVFLENLHSPFGMTLIGDQLYVANTDALLRFSYSSGDTQITSTGTRVIDLPAGPINHHWTKNVIASSDGRTLYVTVGSNSNIAEHGMDNEVHRAAILEIDAATGAMRDFATGLRNPNGLAWNPLSGELWTTVNERDELGNNLVPDYMTSVKDGAFYGWPYSYYGQNVDTRITPARPDLVEKAIAPDYALGAHTAALGLAFYTAQLLPQTYVNGAFVGLHGSWNRKPLSGYKVIFVPFKEGKPAGPPQDILTGFVNDKGQAYGRPVSVIVDKTGALLVSDDVGNVVWRITP